MNTKSHLAISVSLSKNMVIYLYRTLKRIYTQTTKVSIRKLLYYRYHFRHHRTIIYEITCSKLNLSEKCSVMLIKYNTKCVNSVG